MQGQYQRQEIKCGLSEVMEDPGGPAPQCPVLAALFIFMQLTLGGAALPPSLAHPCPLTPIQQGHPLDLCYRIR